MTSVLLSIRLQFASAILHGSKRVEFRKRPFKRPVDKVFLYSTGSTGRVVGMFAVQIVKLLSPRQAWRQYHKVAGISRAAFFEYFARSQVAVCIEIKRVVPAKRPFSPRASRRPFTAPQSFAYLTPRASRRLEKAIGSKNRRLR